MISLGKVTARNKSTAIWLYVLAIWLMAADGSLTAQEASPSKQIVYKSGTDGYETITFARSPLDWLTRQADPVVGPFYGPSSCRRGRIRLARLLPMATSVQITVMESSIQPSGPMLFSAYSSEP